MARGSDVRAVLLWFGLLSSAAMAAPPTVPGPHWGSDQVRSVRSSAPVDALVIDFRREVAENGSPPKGESGSATLAADFIVTVTGDAHALDDFALCRSMAWHAGDAAFTNESCYALPGFRLAELANRRYLRDVLGVASKDAARKLGAADSFYWTEQDLAIQDQPSDPLVAAQTAQGTEWRLGKEVVLRTSGGIAFSPDERKAVGRYIARRLGLHPQVQRALLAAGSLPERIVIERRMFDRRSTETINFSNPRRRKVDYPPPQHLASALEKRAKEQSAEGSGLRQTLLAIAGTAQPPKPTFDELVDRFRTDAEGGRFLPAYLQFMALSLQYGGELRNDPAKVTRLRSVGQLLQASAAAPDVADLHRASTVAGSTAESPQQETAARYLADASRLDTYFFGTFRYLTFANLVMSARDVDGWDKSILEKMPPLADCYWTHITAYPWSSMPFKDLGDYWYRQFDSARAWAAWDLGRAVDPGWGGGPMQSVANLENHLRKLTPNDF
jgi:hypothetical protein